MNSSATMMLASQSEAFWPAVAQPQVLFEAPKTAAYIRA